MSTLGIMINCSKGEDNIHCWHFVSKQTCTSMSMLRMNNKKKETIGITCIVLAMEKRLTITAMPVTNCLSVTVCLLLPNKERQP